jgi:peptide/nickel transport system permease protein
VKLWLGGILVALVVVAALAAPALAPHDPVEMDLLNILLPPFWVAGADPAFPLGTDALGRCLLSRLLYGARIALTVAFVAATAAAVLGSTLALIAGYRGGWVDWLISRAIDVWMSFPPVVLSLILMVAFGVGLWNVVAAIVLVDWTRFARVVRAEVLVVVRRDYIAAARLAGFSHLRTALREVVPAVAPLMLTLLSLEMGIAVVVEAILSFVGLSVGPTVPAWGVMIADGRSDMVQHPYGLLLPVLAILGTVLGFNLLGDGLRQRFDPHHRGRGV